MEAYHLYNNWDHMALIYEWFVLANKRRPRCAVGKCSSLETMLSVWFVDQQKCYARRSDHMQCPNLRDRWSKLVNILQP